MICIDPCRDPESVWKKGLILTHNVHDTNPGSALSVLIHMLHDTDQGRSGFWPCMILTEVVHDSEAPAEVCGVASCRS
jgi:hypothetical protein